MQISLVSQEPVLFARSITDNISYGLPAVPFEVVVEAAQKANAHGFIMELQDGYNTGTCPARSPQLPRGRASGSPPPSAGRWPAVQRRDCIQVRFTSCRGTVCK